MSTSSRLIAIGDIHGHYTKFRNLLDKLDLGKGDEVVILGDIVDYGPQTADVIEYLIDMTRYRKVTTLMGNHDAWFLDYLESSYADPLWYEQGGRQTLDSYGPSRRVPESHRDFIKRLWPPFKVETVMGDVEYVFSHGMLAPTKVIEERFNKDDALWGRPTSYALGGKGWVWRDGVLNVFGHTPHEAPTWYYEKDKRIKASQDVREGAKGLCIDTGAKMDDFPLTAAILPKSQWGRVEFVQAGG